MCVNNFRCASNASMRCSPLVLLAAVMIVAWRGEAFFQLAAQTRAVQQAIAQEASQGRRTRASRSKPIAR